MLGRGCGGMRVAQGAGPRADERGYGGVDETRDAAPEDMVVGVYVVSPGLDGFCQGVAGGEALRWTRPAPRHQPQQAGPPACDTRSAQWEWGPCAIRGQEKAPHTQ